MSTWNTRVEGWLAAALEGFDASTRWYVGRPVLVTANDHELRLYNGDAGVAVADGDRVRVAFDCVLAASLSVGGTLRKSGGQARLELGTFGGVGRPLVGRYLALAPGIFRGELIERGGHACGVEDVAVLARIEKHAPG